MTKPTLTSTTPARESKRRIIFILGLLTAMSPFSIDMYLPAFPQMAAEFGTTVATVSLSLSSFFVGLAFGQLAYGPLLDRFGRKRPLYLGIAINFAACFGCLACHSAPALIIWRLIQALGGCVAGVGSMAIVRDLFDTKESAKVFATLILILGTSPLFAPTLGGYLTAVFGWRSIFGVLAAVSVGMLAAVRFGLPETHLPDPSVNLRLGPTLRDLFGILKDRRFAAYVFSGGFAFAGLYVYLAGATIIFMGHYGLSERHFGWTFALIALGMISSSQLNSRLLKRYTAERLLISALMIQFLFTVAFVAGVLFNVLNLQSTIFMFFAIVAALGISSPNSTALALAPFSHRAGRAAALTGFLQTGLGSAVSMLIALFHVQSILPVTLFMLATIAIGLGVQLAFNFRARFAAMVRSDHRKLA